MGMRIVAGNRTLDVADGLVCEPAPDVEVLDVPQLTAWPALVDMHVHGGGGHAFSTTDIDEARAAADHHARRGSTRVMASLVTAPPGVLASQVETLVPLVAEEVIVGIHLEGPWIAAARCGAHDPRSLRSPDLEELDQLLEIGQGAVRMVTIAPELPGAIEFIDRLVACGVVAAIGHTDADAGAVRDAVRAGATVATHLWNAMPPLAHRAPGPVLELLGAEDVIVEVIADGQHVAPELVSATLDWVGPDRAALVSDAMPAAGLSSGDYRLGELEVEVNHGAARLKGTSTLAGSTITLVDAVTLASGHVGLDRAMRAATSVPCAALGLPEPELRPGARADLILLDSTGSLAGVMRAGRWIVPVSA